MPTWLLNCSADWEVPATEAARAVVVAGLLRDDEIQINSRASGLALFHRTRPMTLGQREVLMERLQDSER